MPPTSAATGLRSRRLRSSEGSSGSSVHSPHCRTLTDELVERLAESAHEIWSEGRQRDGWNFGFDKSEPLKTHPWLVGYDELPEHAREANRVTVRTIP